MAIDRLGPVDPVAKYNKTEKPAKVVKKDAADSVALSEEARHQADLQRVAELVRQAPDVRMDRVNEVKAKLEDPDYIDKSVNAVADKLMDVFGV